MDPLQTAISVALLIGTGVVSWCANRIVTHSERIAKLEVSAARCRCAEEPS